MPQFDIMTFFNQVFWLIFIFFVFYIVVIRYTLPVLAFSLKSRSKILKLAIRFNKKKNVPKMKMQWVTN